MASADGRGDLRVERGFERRLGPRPRASLVLRSALRRTPRSGSAGAPPTPGDPPNMPPVRPVRSRSVFALVLAAALASVPTGARAHPRPVEPLDAGEIAHALHRLQSVGSALYVAAHPDDENTALLAWLTHVKGVRTAYLSMTRVDGGQNLLG